MAPRLLLGFCLLLPPNNSLFRKNGFLSFFFFSNKDIRNVATSPFPVRCIYVWISLISEEGGPPPYPGRRKEIIIFREGRRGEGEGDSIDFLHNFRGSLPPPPPPPPPPLPLLFLSLSVSGGGRIPGGGGEKKLSHIKHGPGLEARSRQTLPFLTSKGGGKRKNLGVGL